MKNRILLSGIFALLLCQCGKNIAGSETTNGDQIIVTATDDRIYGTAPVGHTIYLFSSDYCPYNDSGFSSTVNSDTSGTFSFNNIEEGEYALYCKLSNSDLSAFVQLIQIQSYNLNTSDTVAFDENGSFSGKLIDSSGTPMSQFNVYISGSPFFTITDSLGIYVLDNIPEGNYMLTFIESPNNNNSPKKKRTIAVSVDAGKNTAVDPVIF